MVNLAFDLDNVYDTTRSALWFLCRHTAKRCPNTIL